MQAVVLRARQQWQTAGLSDVGWLSLCTLLFCGSKLLGKQFEGMPGHAGAFWIPTLFLARATVGRCGAATMTALLGSSAWCLSGASGNFNVAAYVSAGLVLDALDVNGDRLRHLPWAIAGGVGCHLAKYAYQPLLGLAIGLRPGSMVKWGAESVALFYIVFGLIGGLVGWLLVRGSDHLRKTAATADATSEGSYRIEEKRS